MLLDTLLDVLLLAMSDPNALERTLKAPTVLYLHVGGVVHPPCDKV